MHTMTQAASSLAIPIVAAGAGKGLGWVVARPDTSTACSRAFVPRSFDGHANRQLQASMPRHCMPKMGLCHNQSLCEPKRSWKRAL